MATTKKHGLTKYIGKRVTVFCSAYFYTGRLMSVGEHDIVLKDAGIVYETGPFTSKDWQDMQKLPHDWHVSLAAIESFGILK